MLVIEKSVFDLWTIHRKTLWTIHRASSRLTSFHKLLEIMLTRLEYIIMIKNTINSHQMYTKNTT